MMRHSEKHRTHRVGWLRAAVLGANDGIISTASLILGVAAASVSQQTLLLTGVAGLVAGAMSMAAGEYISVHSQADTEKADLLREQNEIEAEHDAETAELAAIYQSRGLNEQLAKQVATQLMRHDALGAHARDELGISEGLSAKPLQATLASAASFATGAALPLMVLLLAPKPNLIFWMSASSIVFLALLGVLAAQIGGASKLKGAWRVSFWGALAMLITYGTGLMFNSA